MWDDENQICNFPETSSLNGRTVAESVVPKVANGQLEPRTQLSPTCRRFLLYGRIVMQ